jgi:hypothetical protein
MGSLWIDVGVSGGSRRGKKRWRVTIAGRVVDSSGNGVADVELQVGKQTVYTGATGAEGFMRSWLRNGGIVSGAEHWLAYFPGPRIGCPKKIV